MKISNGIIIDVVPEDLNNNTFVIPHGVRVIGEGAFKACRFIRKIEIPDTVVKIDNEAFWGCMVLETPHIPNSVQNIGERAFKGCKFFHEIDLPEGLTSIDGSAFEDCSNLSRINVSEKNTKFSSIDGVLYSKDKKELIRFPSGKDQIQYKVAEGTARIERDAFESCKKIERISLPNSIEYVDDGAFYSCKLIPEIELPEKKVSDYDDYDVRVAVDFDVIHSLKNLKGLKRIRLSEKIQDTIGIDLLQELEEINVDEKNENFSSNEGILFSKDKKRLIVYPKARKEKAYSVPDGVTIIEAGAFSGCKNIEQVFFPDSLEGIEIRTFYKCNKLRQVEIRRNVKYIREDAFKKCENLKSVKLPDSLKRIYTGAFEGCRKLEDINIPSQLDYIGDGAFMNCPNKTRGMVLQFVRNNPEVMKPDSDWEKDGEQIWQNLSDRKFESMKVDKRSADYIDHNLKTGVGTWFSLPSKNSETSEWEDTMINCNYKYKTTAMLKDTAYIVELSKWKDVIQDVLKSTDINLPIIEKRKILLNRIKQETGNDNIEYLIYHVRDSEWADITELYYQQNGEKKKWEKINFIMGNLFKYNQTDMDQPSIDENNIDFITNNFEEYKSMVNLRIKLLKLVTAKQIQYMSYSDIEKYLNDKEKKMLRFLHFDDIVRSLSAYEESSAMNAELLDEYETFINNMKDAEEFKKFIDKYKGTRANTEACWFVDYFSGCIARGSVPTYDVDSMVVFDTDCVKIIKNEPIVGYDQDDDDEHDGGDHDYEDR